jgi:hypothetical protein
MHRNLIRTFAFILIPCLAADTVSATGFYSLGISRMQVRCSMSGELLSKEALAPKPIGAFEPPLEPLAADLSRTLIRYSDPHARFNAFWDFVQERKVVFGMLSGLGVAALSYWEQIHTGFILNARFAGELGVDRTLISVLLGALGGIVTTLLALNFWGRYPLRQITALQSVPHPERENNIRQLKRALGLPPDAKVDEAYDAMVADISGRARNHLLPEGHWITMYFLEKQDGWAGELANLWLYRAFPTSVKKSAPLKISFSRYWLNVNREGHLSRTYKLVLRDGDYQSIKVITPNPKGPVEKDLQTFIEEVAGITLEEPLGKIISRVEVGGIGVLKPNWNHLDLYREDFHSYVVFNGQGTLLSVGINSLTTSFSAPSRSPKIMSRYGKFMFGYHFHPFASEPSSSDKSVIRECCKAFGRIIPEIIWHKDGRLNGHIYVPKREYSAYDNNFSIKDDYKEIVLPVTLASRHPPAIRDLSQLPPVSADQSAQLHGIETRNNALPPLARLYDFLYFVLRHWVGLGVISGLISATLAYWAQVHTGFVLETRFPEELGVDRTLISVLLGALGGIVTTLLALTLGDRYLRNHRPSQHPYEEAA